MRSIEEARGQKSTVNFGSVPYESYVHAVCDGISDYYKKARELLMLHKAFMTANEIYQIYVPTEVRDLAINFEASKITAGDVVRIMEGLVGILSQQTNKSLVESMYAEVPVTYFQTAEGFEEINKKASLEPRVVSVTEAGDGKSMIVEFEDGSAILGIKDDINNIKKHEADLDLQTIYIQHDVVEEADWCMAHFMQSKVTVDSMVGKTVRKVSFSGRDMEILFTDESAIHVKALNGMCCWSPDDGEPEH